MTVLITRAQEDNIKLASKIKGLGVDVFSEPIIEFHINQPNNKIDYNHYHSFIFTSKNAVKYLRSCKYTSLLNKQCFAIGDTTAKMLKDMGFVNVMSADNDIKKLIEGVKSFSAPNVFYFRGEEISLDIKKILSDNKIECEEYVCYKVKKSCEISDLLIKKIVSYQINVVLFFSKNTAESFLSLCNKYDIAKFMKKVTILTVSAKLKEALKSKVKNTVESFDGDEDSLLELIRLQYASK
ncbi:MAG: uroporphyrinogen-III synthase [Alphaproteobacteria bacterium]|nr:uroporphyrinogen-III synthase [Alphaproteobacteria bacterium]